MPFKTFYTYDLGSMYFVPTQGSDLRKLNNAWRLKLYLFQKKQTTFARHFIITSGYILKVEIQNLDLALLYTACHI